MQIIFRGKIPENFLISIAQTGRGRGVSRGKNWKVRMKGQKVATRKVEDGQKTLFPRIVRGPLGCHLLSSLVPKSGFRGSEKQFFLEMQNEV